jgi:Xaa-Pro aminopeptidase
VTRRDPLYNAEALDEAFESAGLDAIVARSGRNVAYLSGMTFPGTLGRLQDFANSPRAAVVVWSRSADPTLFVSNIATGLAHRDSWLDDIRSFTEYRDSPYAMAARQLKEMGLGRARIGVERRELGADHWDEFSSELADAELIDCTDLLESVRNVKTAGEIALLRQAVDIQDQAHLDVFAEGRPGVTEKQLHTKMVAAMLELGAESAHGMLQCSETPMTYGGEGQTPINRGDAIRTDYVSYYKGYAANLSRMAVMGPPSEDQQRMYSVLRNVHRATIENALFPGNEVRSVHAFVKSQFEAAGFEWNKSLVGHSIGVWWHQEEPMFVPGEQRQLRAGMVVCLEPILEMFWHLQDQILITDDGPELMSAAFDTSELFVIGGS